MLAQEVYAISTRIWDFTLRTIQIPSAFIPMDLIPILAHLRSEHQIFRMNILETSQKMLADKCSTKSAKSGKCSAVSRAILMVMFNSKIVDS